MNQEREHKIYKYKIFISMVKKSNTKVLWECIEGSLAQGIVIIVPAVPHCRNRPYDSKAKEARKELQLEWREKQSHQLINLLLRTAVKKMLKKDAKFQLFFTEKHAQHDSTWTFQNSSLSSICFACAVETLDDATSLNVRKRRMVSDIMDLLTTNSSIWQIFTKQRATLSHTGDVLLKLLSSKDKQLSTLVVETLGVLVQRSTEDNAVSLLQSLVTVLHGKRTNSNLENMAPYFCFLGKILRRSGSAVKTFLTDHYWLFEIIIENVGEMPESEAISYWYILAQIYRNEQSRHVNIRNSKLVIEKVTSVIGNSVSKDLQLNILSVLMSFAKNKLLCELITDDESEFSLSQNSVANMMKKLMLSTNSDIQRISVQCLTEVMKISSAHDGERIINFSQILMTKGVCEFLFELLGFSDRLLTATVLNCLQRFAEMKMFFSAGHVIYGIEPIVESLRRAIAAKDRLLLYPALHLLLTILRNIKSTSSIEKHASSFLEMTTQLSEMQETDILNLTVSCATEVIKHDTSREFNLETILMVMERFGKRLSKKSASSLGKRSADPDTLNLLKTTLDFARCSTEFITNDDSCQGTYGELAESASQPNGINKLGLQAMQRIADLYLIPSTVMLLPFVKEQEVFRSFFKILVAILGNSNHSAFAKKLCESSFVRIALEVKAGIMTEDQACESGTLIDNFLVLLVCKLDDSGDEIGLNNTLSLVFSALQTPPGEWHLLFNKAPSSLDMNIVHPIRLACIPLLYISVRFGDPLWKSDVILRCMSIFMEDEQQFHDLPIAVRRHVIYLWAYARNNTKTTGDEVSCADSKIASLIEKELTPGHLFIPEGCFVHWVLDSATEMKTKVWALSELFLLDKNAATSGLEATHIEDILKNLASYRDSLEFYAVCTEILATGKLSVVKQAINVIAFVTGGGTKNEVLSKIKTLINRKILSQGSELDHFNLVALLELYRHLLLSHASQIADVDLKLASRLCSLFLEYSVTDIRVALLNSLNQFLYHLKNNSNASQAAVVCNQMFLEELDKFMPRQVISEGIEREKLSSASLVFVSQLTATISSQKFPTVSIRPIIVQKEVLILSLACSRLPLIQLACLEFWNCFLTLSPKQSYIFQSMQEPLYLSEHDLKTILIYIQNLMLNEEQLIREASMTVVFKVVEALKLKNSDFHSPWNEFILLQLLDSLAPDSELEIKLKTIHFLIKNGTCLAEMTAVLAPVMSLIKDGLLDSNIEVLQALLQLISILAKDVQLSVHQLTDMKKFLHSLEDKARGLLPEENRLEQSTRPAFVVYHDVLLPIDNEDQATTNSYLESITKCKDLVDCQERSTNNTNKQIN